jgi:putative phosphoribosyl transferase
MQSRPPVNNLVQVRTDGVTLEGSLDLPENARGIVLFVHGSGSSRHSPRNRYVAESFQENGLGTLLFDMLTSQEEEEDRTTRQLRFDIELLARRTGGALEWLSQQPHTAELPVGLFGASTGAAAALIAAAERPDLVRAVVSRGGRPDLANGALPQVQAPTLLIVGEMDDLVLVLNKRALEHMSPEGAPKQMRIVPGATHLFEEPGTLDQAAHLASEWFFQYLKPPAGL